MPTASGSSASPSSGLYRPVRIGSTSVPGNVFLAPMAGYTDAPFRSVCVESGACLCFTEMVSAEALSRESAKTMRLLVRAPDETAIAFQIFASTPRAAAAAVRLIAPLQPVLIDLNCGCSVPKVLRTGCGAALLRNPGVIGTLVSAMGAETDIPVTVKLRSGWDSSSINFIACAEAAVTAAAALVTLHPRTRAQGFSGKARWEEIRELKRSLGEATPVFGSGDLFAAEDCRAMLETTGCDGVMIARGCLGNPFIFAETRALLEGGGDPAAARGAPIETITPRRRLDTAMRHLLLLAESVGEAKACRDMRKHFVAYTRGMVGGAALRQEVVHAASIAEYGRIVEAFLSVPAGHA
ncbi:MAG: tRNA dihydrouridine synthase DusB [Spirochaetes bacterium]|nr:tRNA dihydrouridine synthase DusB [Spirochaetota bacterium]